MNSPSILVSGAPASTVEQLRAALANIIDCSVQELQDSIGNVVVTVSDDPLYSELLARVYPSSTAMAVYDKGDQQRGASTVFFADRIPAGIEEQAILREVVQLHARKVNPYDWELVADAPESWGSWGRFRSWPSHPLVPPAPEKWVGLPGEEVPQERQIYDAVSSRIKRSKQYQLPPMKETRFIFTVQEAVARGVQPAQNGRGVDGWLHTVFDTVQKSVLELLGRDLNEYTPQDFVKLLQIGSPFEGEIAAMKRAKQSMAQREKLVSSRADRMRELDAKFESMQAQSKPSDAPLAVIDREGALLQRIADLTSQLTEAKSAIGAMASEGRDGSWHASCYLGDDVTSMVSGALSIVKMNSALWDIKVFLDDNGRAEVSTYDLDKIADIADEGLFTGVGTSEERSALKAILADVHQAEDAQLGLPVSVVLAEISKALPLVASDSELQDTPQDVAVRDNSPSSGM